MPSLKNKGLDMPYKGLVPLSKEAKRKTCFIYINKFFSLYIFIYIFNIALLQCGNQIRVGGRFLETGQQFTQEILATEIRR